MKSNDIAKLEYRNWLRELKQKVRQAQVKAAVQVNTALLSFYWDLGADILERLEDSPMGEWVSEAAQCGSDG